MSYFEIFSAFLCVPLRLCGYIAFTPLYRRGTQRLAEKKSGAEPLAKLESVLPQREPIGKNLRILQPNRKPLAHFFRQPAIAFICSYAGYDKFELALQTQNGRTQNLLIRTPGEFFHPRDRGGDVVEAQLFGGKQTRRAPTYVGVENVRMGQRGAAIRTCSSDRCGTGVRLGSFIYHYGFF